VRTLSGTVNRSKVWMRIEGATPSATLVTVQMRAALGGSDLTMANELQNRIAPVHRAGQRAHLIGRSGKSTFGRDNPVSIQRPLRSLEHDVQRTIKAALHPIAIAGHAARLRLRDVTHTPGDPKGDTGKNGKSYFFHIQRMQSNPARASRTKQGRIRISSAYA